MDSTFGRLPGVNGADLAYGRSVAGCGAVSPSVATARSAWHGLRSPGAYEWWYFDAICPSPDGGSDPLIVVAILYSGFPFTPAYYSRRAERAEAAERAGDPFRLSPDPADHAAVSLSVSRGRDVLATGVSEFGPSHFSASREEFEVGVGGNRALLDAAGRLRVELDLETIALGRRLRSPGWNQRTCGCLHFEPIGLQPGDVGLSLNPSSVDSGVPTDSGLHAWNLIAPRCRVSGELSMSGSGAGSVVVSGLGYHDHNFGNRAMDLDLKRWCWGRMSTERTSIVLYDSLSRAGRSVGSVAWQIDPEGPWHQSERFVHRVLRRGWNVMGIRNPVDSVVEARSSHGMSLEVRTRVVDVVEMAPFYLRYLLSFEGQWSGGGQSGTFAEQGMGEYLVPRRLRSSLVQAMMRTRMRYTR